MGLGIVKLGQGQWAVKDGNLLAAKDTNGRLKNTEFTVTRGTRATYVGRDGLIKESNLQDVNLVNNGDFSELGSELVTNGTFDTDTDWVKGSGWSIANGKASCNGSSTNLSQNGVLVVGKNYKITITVTNYVSGTVEVSAGAAPRGTMSANGTYTFYQNATPTTNFYIVAQSFNGSVDNVSIQQVDPNDYWTFSGDSFTFPDGAVRIARTTSTTFIQQNVLTSGRLYKVEFDVLDKPDNNGTFIVRLGANNVYDVSTYEGTRFSKYITSSGIDFRIYSSSDNGVIYVDNIVVSEVKTDTPRIDFTDNTDGHLLLEPQSTNLLTYSEDFSQWTLGSNSTLTYESDVVAPDGSLGVYRLTNPATSSTYIQSPLFTYNNPITLSIYAKYADASNNEFDLYDGTNTTRKITTSEWQRFDAVGFGNQLTIVNSGDTYITDIYIWGGQAEALSYPTSYIPTNGSTVTRDADTCTGSGEAVDFNSEEGVLYAEIAALVDDDTSDRVISLSDNSITNRVEMKLSSSGYIQGRFDSASSDITLTETGLTASNFNKIALIWSSGKCALFINGVKEQEDLIFNTFASDVLFDVSFDSAYLGGSSNFYGKCKALRVYKEALSDTDLENLTSL